MDDGGSVILWDFDGTLAERPGMWRGCLTEVLDEHEPGHRVSSEMFVPFLRDGFPWHAPDTAHPELSPPGAWWSHVEPLLVRGYEGVGIGPDRARTLGRLARQRYVDPEHWRLFDDTRAVLSDLRECGWRHAILSNHVPELGRLVTALGLSELIDVTINSAETGYEKPHPEAFALARRVTGEPEEIWMVGDNPIADIGGAESASIPGILVRRSDDVAPNVTRRAKDLRGVRPLLVRTAG
jgi:putative hydrolase of the HAD superfamily